MIKLLVADDHIVVREAICEFLNSKGNFEIVGQAADGKELLDMLMGCSPDLVILDVQMPKIDGIAALEEMRKNNNQAPVLVISGEENKQNIRTALKAGANGFISKNARPEELVFAIQSILDGHSYVSPSIALSLISEDPQQSNSPKGLENSLTKREIEILTHLADGKTNREIGKLLHISIRTVDTHRSNILKKLKVKTNAQLTKIALSYGLIKL
ncbi:MAG: response regulator transcription factor [SAR324 cluster bacterium]|uniref:Response regulator transcription factor n=1 Tax=SAR324 cluster bacterium TaxID=2024889 RepID=A0A7X9IIA1_9DELT|nr:response regulator transcription factor [SAR324 cluster bacterium]